MSIKKWLEKGSLSPRDADKYLEKVEVKKYREALMKFIKENNVDYFSMRELSEKSGLPICAVRALVHSGLAENRGGGVYRMIESERR